MNSSTEHSHEEDHLEEGKEHYKEKLITRRGVRTPFEVSLIANLYDSLFGELDSIVSRMEETSKATPSDETLKEYIEAIRHEKEAALKLKRWMVLCLLIQAALCIATLALLLSLN